MASLKSIFCEKKVCVLIPTYNNATTLGPLLQDILQYTDQIIVVNDGSTDHTAELLATFPEVKVASYGINRGKGFALRYGFKTAQDAGYAYAITIDSDGQHFADDLPVFMKALEQHTRAIIVGARNMDQASVPGKSNFGRNFSNFWYRFETGLSMADTQSGYRLYPLEAINKLRWLTRKFEFEIEVLVRAAWAGIDVVEVPVKVYYPSKDERVSHFRPFRDFTRISILNTVLVTITLLYIKPRDLLRNIKKKTSGKDLSTSLSTQTKQLP